mmetsp:Transcript_101416/g.287394  ORF Transcript_101416/g.287394 Transcript_101416/m.287394 type:complete len:152 (+) Transcript_101416:82-537(+)
MPSAWSVTLCFALAAVPGAEGVGCYTSDCNECTNFIMPTYVSSYYACYWCHIDNQCWAMANWKSPCYKAADNMCYSKSMISQCSGAGCPAALALTANSTEQLPEVPPVVKGIDLFITVCIVGVSGGFLTFLYAAWSSRFPRQRVPLISDYE